MNDKNTNAGFLLVDKPAGLTSHDAVNRVRRITGQRRVGHAGTLDPLATGLLIVGVGREATREMSRLVGLDKTYEAEFILGGVSDTDDRTGKITKFEIRNPAEPGPAIPDQKLETNQKFEIRNSKEQIQKAMKELTGEIKQVPPQYSAIKVKGVKMYEAARKGKPIEVGPRPVRVDEFEMIGEPIINKNGTVSVKAKIGCSSGTYIRALARDLGEKLEVGGYVAELRRTKIGPFTVAEAALLEELPSVWKSRLWTWAMMSHKAGFGQNPARVLE